MTTYIGIDLGGTKIAAVAFDTAADTFSGQKVTPTEGHEGPDAVLKRAAALVKDVCQHIGVRVAEIGGVGLGVPAVIDMDSGQTILLPNIPGDWNGRYVAPTVSQHLNRPVWLVNDARAFTLAEATRGAGHGARTVAGFTIGTGIGGGLVLDGRLHLGVNGTAGEVGHMIIDPNGPLCGCGNRGCFEAHCSGPAIAAMGVKAVMQGMTTCIGDLANHDLNQITPQLMMQAAEAGDAVARDILERAGEFLGIGIGNVITLFSPEKVVIGGGVSALGEWIFAPIRKTIKERCRAAPVDKVEIVRAALGTDAGAMGAAIWAAQKGEN
jgi:glucokinase